jgi:hypothetical protein
VSSILNTAARQRIGDGANSAAITVTTSAAEQEIPAALRGKYVKLIASAGTVYISSGPELEGPTAATAANGFEVVSGTAEQVEIPTFKDNQDTYTVSVIGTEAATLKVILVSP